jgi:hypothetical protein
MSVVDIAKLSIMIDSSSAKTTAVDLETLGQKAVKMCTTTNVALGYLSVKLNGIVQETAKLAARFETLGAVMNVAGRARAACAATGGTAPPARTAPRTASRSNSLHQ